MTRPWTQAQIPDQSGRRAVITGANTGLGFSVAKTLAAKNATVILAVRNKKKGVEAKEAIIRHAPEANIQVEILDLANLQSIFDFGKRVDQQVDKIDLLINNAGVMMPPLQRTADGYELQIGANHLGHFVLTAQLFPLLCNTPGSRIVTVSSLAHKGKGLNLGDLNWKQRPYKKLPAYNASKLANLLFHYELNRRLQHSDYATVATAAHPGVSNTNLSQHNLMAKWFMPLFGQSVDQGALPILRAAIDLQAQPGDYFGPAGLNQSRGKPVIVKSSKDSKDPALASRLWKLSEEITGISFAM